jgi:phosphomannomutase / phosphoglucomutase
MIQPSVQSLSTTLLPPSNPALGSSCFKPCDIRAVVGDTFNAQTYAHLGKAYSAWLYDMLVQKGHPTESSPWVVLGWDARLHSEALATTLIESLKASGVSVLCLGQVPSPLVYFAEQTVSGHCFNTPISPVGSIVVTASHNPSEYNGVKFTLLGKTLSAETLLTLKSRFEELAQHSSEGSADDCAQTGKQEKKKQEEEPVKKGTQQNWSVIPAYLDWHLKQFPRFKSNPKVVIDSGNATAGCVAPELLRQLGCDVISIFEDPDGRFPNHHPDPSVAENLKALQETVLKHQADLGIAFDGDADRLCVVTNQGDIVPGDQLLMILMRHLATQPVVNQATSPVCVVTEVKCSQHVFEEARRLRLNCLLSPTGHAYIKATMAAKNALLGGELSGHMFFRDRHWGFDDAIYAAIRVLEVLEAMRMNTPKAGLSHLTQSLPQTCLSQEKRINSVPALRQQVLTQIESIVKKQTTCCGLPVLSIDQTDGIRVNLPGGFWLVRASNTEPCLSVRCEAPDATTLSLLEQYVEHLILTVLQ